MINANVGRVAPLFKREEVVETLAVLTTKVGVGEGISVGTMVGAMVAEGVEEKAR